MIKCWLPVCESVCPCNYLFCRAMSRSFRHALVSWIRSRRPPYHRRCQVELRWPPLIVHRPTNLTGDPNYKLSTIRLTNWMANWPKNNQLATWSTKTWAATRHACSPIVDSHRRLAAQLKNDAATGPQNLDWPLPTQVLLHLYRCLVSSLPPPTALILFLAQFLLRLRMLILVSKFYQRRFDFDQRWQQKGCLVGGWVNRKFGGE